MASTGGTVVCRALATHSQVLVLSEVSPAGRRASRFVPDTPFASLLASKLLTDPERERLFHQQMTWILDFADRRGWQVLVRDHPHSDFMLNSEPSRVSSLVRVMGENLGRRAVLVRHPLDSYLSSLASNFLVPALRDLDSYCTRLLRFHDVHGDLPTFRYEAFCDDPDLVLPCIAEVLGLPYEPDWRDRLADVRLSGNSGRAAHQVAPRARRDVPDDVASQAATSQAFAEACHRLGYASGGERDTTVRQAGATA
jgi:hypothetical protein